VVAVVVQAHDPAVLDDGRPTSADSVGERGEVLRGIDEPLVVQLHRSLDVVGEHRGTVACLLPGENVVVDLLPEPLQLAELLKQRRRGRNTPGRDQRVESEPRRHQR
jgi:hypothetical protein